MEAQNPRYTEAGTNVYLQESLLNCQGYAYKFVSLHSYKPKRNRTPMYEQQP